MNNRLLKHIILLTVLGSLNSPMHAIFESLTLWKLKNTDGREIEVFTIGDVHFNEAVPNSSNALRDKKDAALVKSALHQWNNTDDQFAFLGESGSYIAGSNEKAIQNNLEKWKIANNIETLENVPEEALPYNSIYYTFPKYITTNKQLLKNITFDMCDKRDKAVWETKREIIILETMFKKLLSHVNQIKHEEMLISNGLLKTGIDRSSMENNAIQQNIKMILEQNQKVSAQSFLEELKNAKLSAKIAMSDEENPLDEITREELSQYTKDLENGIEYFKTFFKQQLNNNLQGSTLNAITHYIEKTAKFDGINQETDTTKTYNCINDICLPFLSAFSTQHQETTNCIANIGYILAFCKEKEKHDKIVTFFSNNQTVAFAKYLAKYQKNGAAYSCFKEGQLDYQYGSSAAHPLSHERARNLFCIPFNKSFIPKEIPLLVASAKQLEQKTKPYYCQNCSHISYINKKFNCCARCKDTYYCSKYCQQTDWAVHKNNCKPCVEIKKEPPANVSSDVETINSPKKRKLGQSEKMSLENNSEQQVKIEPEKTDNATEIQCSTEDDLTPDEAKTLAAYILNNFLITAKK